MEGAVLSRHRPQRPCFTRWNPEWPQIQYSIYSEDCRAGLRLGVFVFSRAAVTRRMHGHLLVAELLRKPRSHPVHRMLPRNCGGWRDDASSSVRPQSTLPTES